MPIDKITRLQALFEEEFRVIQECTLDDFGPYTQGQMRGLFIAAAECNNTKVLDWFVSSGMIQIVKREDLGKAISRAAMDGQYKVLEQRLITHSEFQHVPTNGALGIGNALVRAAENGCRRTLQLLFDSPQAVNMTIPEKQKISERLYILLVAMVMLDV